MTCVTKTAGGARPTEAEGRALHEANTGGPSGAIRTSSRGGSESDFLKRGRHETEHDCVMNAYKGTYCAYACGGKEPAKSAYLSANETRNEPSLSPPATRGRIRSPPPLRTPAATSRAPA